VTEPTGSPYRPGFSNRPPTLAGRDDILAAADEALAIGAQDKRAPTPLLLVGPRGVGKTVLLDEIGARAGQRYGWPHLALEVTGGSFAAQLIAGAREMTALLDMTSPSQRMKLSDATIRAGIPGVSAELQFSRQHAEPITDPALAAAAALTELAQLASDNDTGVLVTIDELQLAERVEIAGFGATLQRAMREEWPLLVVGAGLDSMRSAGRLPTYFERADWQELGLLDPEATLMALAEPAREAGRPFEPAAAAQLAEQTGGYPYAIQLYGHQAWRASYGFTTITLGHANVAAAAAEQQLAQGLYANRLAQVSAQERAYLIAAAHEQHETGAITGGNVARRLHLTTKAASPIRARLIAKGVLSATGRDLRFAIPGMSQYILRMSPTPPAPGASSPRRGLQR
jgi:hypothetical protein